MMIFFRFYFPFFVFLCFFFAPRCSVRATSAGALPLSSLFYIGWHPMPQKRQRISRCLSYVHSAGLYPVLILSFAAELYFAFYSVYAPLIYVRLYFTSCPVMVYTFSPRMMYIWPSRTTFLHCTLFPCTSSMPVAVPSLVVVNSPE